MSAEDNQNPTEPQVEETVAVEETNEAPEAAQGEVSELEQVKEALAAAEAKAEDNWQQFVRARAEMENIQRRAKKDLEQAHKFGTEKLINDLLAVVDSMEMGLAAAKEESADLEKIVEGSELTLKMFQQMFERFNVACLNPAGEKFDPQMHEAMSMQPTADAEPNTVMFVVQKGYTLNDRLLRPARVVVSQAVQPPPEAKKIDEQA